jgi:molecular chaperone DnaK
MFVYSFSHLIRYFTRYCRLIHSVGKNLEEHGDKVDDATKTEIQTAIDEAKGLAPDASVDDIKAKATALQSASMKIGQAMYGKGQGAEGAEGAAEEGKEAEGEKKEDAQDADYEEKKEGEKK